MSDDGAVEGCHALPLGLPISDDWGIGEDGDAAFAATLNSRLRSVVIERIAPLLVLMHREKKSGRGARLPSRDDVDAFAQAILAADPQDAHQLFQRLRESGVSVDELCETLLAPTARRLGELWDEDVCDFVDVTVGVNRLRVMLELYAGAPVQVGSAQRRALLIAMPNDAHRFGLDMVATFLRASGWDAEFAIGASAEENARTVSQAWFAVAGVSISEESRLEAAARQIDSVRRASLNRAISVMAGGPALRGRPDLVARIGADAGAEDGPSAALLAHKLYLAQGAPRRLTR